MKCRIIYVKDDVINYYRKVDKRILDNGGHSNNKRPYVEIKSTNIKNEIIWAIPIASYNTNRATKQLQNNPFTFILKEKNKYNKAVLQFNNMIPLKRNMYNYVDLNSLDKKYSVLIKVEIGIINSNIFDIYKIILFTLTNYKNKIQCCNMDNLINTCLKYKK